MKIFTVVLLLAGLAFAAAPQYDLYTVSHSATLAGSSVALSIQLPDAGSHEVYVLESTVSCSAACQVRLERGGEGASANGSTVLAAEVRPLKQWANP